MIEEPTWTLENKEIRLQGHHASFGYGGCLRAGGEVEAAVARKAEQGDELIAWVNGEPKWAGRVSRTPLVHHGKALLEASGYRIKAERTVDPYLAQTQDPALFSPIDSPPWSHVHQGRHKIQADAQGILVFRVDRGQEISSGDEQSLIFAAPGTPGGLQRVAFDWQAGNASGNNNILVRRADYPGVGDLSILQTIGLNATSGTVDTGVLANLIGHDSIALTLAATAAFTTIPAYMLLIKNLRVNGVAPGDAFTTSEVVADMGGRLGFDVSGVQPSGMNALPFFLTSGNWLEAGLFHMSVLDGWAPPLILPRRHRTLGPYLEYGPWGRKMIPLSLERDAKPALDSMEIVNGVVVHFTTTNQATDRVIVRPSDIDLDDPLASKDADNFLHITLPEPQPPDRVLPTAMGKAHLTRLVKPRNEGTLEVASVPDHTLWDLLPGYHILAEDYGPLEAVELPIETLELREGQPATVGIHSPGEELGLALVVGLERARAMQLAGFIRHEDLWLEALKDWKKDRQQIAKDLRRFYSGGRKGDLRDFKERRKQLLKDLHDKEATKGQKKTARRSLKELRKDRREREKELLAEQEEQLAEEPYPEDYFEPFP